MMQKTKKRELIVQATGHEDKYILGDRTVMLPDGWEFVPSGDAALTRRLKAAVSEYWIVRRCFGHREFNVGLCVPRGFAAQIKAELEAERLTPEYRKKLAASRKRSAVQQELYKEDFEAEVLKFLNFHPRWKTLASELARIITDFTTPVGSGTVARTKRIPVEQRARAAVIAWMRHNTTMYDNMRIPLIKGKRREVRRELAQDSLELLDSYRRGEDAALGCPLQKALREIQNGKS